MNASTCTVKIPISSMNAKKKSASVAAVLCTAPARAAAVSEERVEGDGECCSAVAADVTCAAAGAADLVATCVASRVAPPGDDSRAVESRVDARSSRAASRIRPASRGRILFPLSRCRGRGAATKVRREKISHSFFSLPAGRLLAPAVLSFSHLCSRVSARE